MPLDLQAVLGPDLPSGATLDDNARVAVAFSRNAYLVVWTNSTGDLRALRVSADGAVLDSAPITIATATVDEGPIPAVASDGSGWIVVWQDHRVPQNINIYGARVDAAGVVLDPTGFPVSTAIDHQTSPAIAFDGTSYLVVWADHRSASTWNVYGARLTPAGAVLDPNGIAICTAPNQQMSPAVAFDGTNYLAVWNDQRSGNLDIYGARVSPAGAVLDPAGIPISRAAGAQTSPAAVFDGADVLVAWQDGRNGLDMDVYAARVGPDGTVRDPSGLAIATGPGDQGPPELAFDGRYVALTWRDAGSSPSATARAVRMDAGGRVLDAAPVLLAEGIGHVATIASDGAGRALALYDLVDAGAGTSHMVGRIMTDWATLTTVRAGSGGGTIASSPDGIACGTVCSAPFDGGTVVTLTPAPDADSGFAGWSGACSGTGACTVTMNAATSVTASFLPLYPLSVSLGSAVHGTVTSSPSGIDCGTACSARYLQGTQVRLSPAGDARSSVFGTWSGACAGSGECVVTMNGPQAVAATFLPAFGLTLSPSGTGVGSLSAAGTTCATGPSCTVDVVAGATVDVAATPSADSVLKTWSGCASSAQTHCSVQMSTTRWVSARFEPASFALTAAFSGMGAGSIAGPGGLSCSTGSSAGCTAAVPNPPYTSTYSSVALAVSPAAGSVFKSWSGCTADAVNPASCSVVVNGAKMVSARLEAATIPLTASFSGTGVGTILGGGLSCTTGGTGTCTAQVQNPNLTTAYSTVDLAAEPSAGSVFKSWTGCTASATNAFACSLLVSSARTVTGRFEPDTIPLSATCSGTGVGTIAGAGLACTTGVAGGCSAGVPNPNGSPTYTTVTLRTTPATGSVFKSWSGCTAVANDPAACTVTMSNARSVAAKFEPSTIPLTATTSGTGAGAVTSGDVPLSCASGSSAGCTAAVPNPNNSSAYNTVTLRAGPTGSSVFKSWSGCTPLSGDPAGCSILVSSARSVGARFEPDTIPLSATTTGTGVGTISGAGLGCTTGSTSGCAALVANPANSATYNTVTVAASAAIGSVLKSWVGCTPLAADPASCSVLVSSAKSVSARFEPETIPLSVTLTGTGAGTVTGAGVGCSTGSTSGCTAAIPNPDNSPAYTTVTLRAAASAGSVFKSWGGCTPLATDPASCSVLVSSAKSVSAKFEPDAIPLTVALTGTGAGAVTGAGLDCATGSTSGCTVGVPNPATSSAYTTVTLRAAPSAGSVFKSWSGCTPLATDPASCSLLVSSAKNVSARFEPDTIPLTVAVTGSGAGTVTGAGLDCSAGSTCTVGVPNPANSAAYTTVTLTGSPATGSLLKSWSGCTPLATDPSSCSILVSSAKNVSARFDPATYALSAIATGTGTGTVTGPGIDCAIGATSGCSSVQANGATVTLVAAPDATTYLKSWSGCAQVSGTSCTVLMSSAKTVTATFQATTLAVYVTGAGTGTVSGGPIACSTGSSGTCGATLTTGTVVTLTATPGASSIFTQWSGCPQPSGNVCTVGMSVAQRVVATFQPATYAITLSFAGTGAGDAAAVVGGAITASCASTAGTCVLDEPYGSTVTLVPTPAQGSSFTGWSGSCTGLGDCVLPMTAARTARATFSSP